MPVNFKSKTRAVVVYSFGLISGIGIVAASIVGATDSSIPYTFQDGQVISADTMNDLFGRIKMSNEGFASVSDLDGDWSCITYDFSGQTPTSGMPNSQFSADSATGFQAITQTWTFSNGSLSMDKLHLGGVAANNTGGCSGQTSYRYAVNIIPPFLALTGNQGCTNGNGYVLAVKRTSAYKFTAPLDQTVMTCTAVNQPPLPPTGLTATVANSTVVLNWVDNGGNPSSYSVLKKSNGQYSTISTVSAGTTTYTDTSGSVGDLYRIKSVNTNGSSLASQAAIAK